MSNLRPASKRAIEAAETRRSIVMAAKACFCGAPYESVTMRAIADLAGCSTGAIFANWPGKDALFAEVMGRRPITDARGAQLLEAVWNLEPSTACAIMGESWTAGAIFGERA
jgi:AcrR family transcriptional regulator